MQSLIKKQIVIGLGATAGLIFASPVEAVTLNLSWTGQTLGYTAEGSFSYDETDIPDDGIIRAADLTAFDIAFFTPQGDLLKAFQNNQTTAGFNFNFDTATGEILQTGRWDMPNGINIGGVREADLNFFSVPNPKADLFSDDAPSPHVHLTDWGDEFPDLPLGFTRGARPHLDVAFFTRTRAEVLADPTAGDELGQKLVATPVQTEIPEPSTWLSLGVVALALGLQSRSKAFHRSM